MFALRKAAGLCEGAQRFAATGALAAATSPNEWSFPGAPGVLMCVSEPSMGQRARNGRWPRDNSQI